MVHTRRLGKGLDSLIPTEAGDGSAAVREIPLSAIELNPRQPREQIDQEELQALANSIKSCGVLQPVIVRQEGELYQLAAGERRLRAARLAGLQTVPALVRDLSDEQMLQTALVENIQRQDLNPIEKARAIRQLIHETGLTQEQAGQQLGLERSTIANMLRLLELPEEVRHMVSRGTLTAGHARALLAIEDDAERARAAKKIASQGLSVRQAEALAARAKASPGADAAHAISLPIGGLNPEESPHIREMETELQRALGTRAQIRRAGQKGKIIIHFASYEDFERIFELITRTAAEPPQKASA